MRLIATRLVSRVLEAKVAPGVGAGQRVLRAFRGCSSPACASPHLTNESHPTLSIKRLQFPVPAWQRP